MAASGEDDYFEVPPSDPVFFNSGDGGGTAVTVRLRAGDMLLWDSRLVHCNTSNAWKGGGEGDVDGAHTSPPPAPTSVSAAGVTAAAEPGGPGGLARAVCFVCMTPAARKDAAATAKKIAATATIHSGCEGPEFPDTATMARRWQAVETGDTTTHTPWQDARLPVY